jgi:hypothetical protein
MKTTATHSLLGMNKPVIWRFVCLECAILCHREKTVKQNMTKKMQFGCEAKEPITNV